MTDQALEMHNRLVGQMFKRSENQRSLRHFTHLQSGDRIEDKITLLTAILADALNLELSKMAMASPEISYRRLASRSVADWYIREETYLSDQYDPFYVKVISTTVRQASYALDGLLYHETDLAIQEHYTDTLGYTDHVFALCHLLGFRFSLRIRQFNHQRLYIEPGKLAGVGVPRTIQLIA